MLKHQQNVFAKPIVKFWSRISCYFDVYIITAYTPQSCLY